MSGDEENSRGCQCDWSGDVVVGCNWSGSVVVGCNLMFGDEENSRDCKSICVSAAAVGRCVRIGDENSSRVSSCGWVGDVPPRRTLLCRRYMLCPTSDAEFGRRLRDSRLPFHSGFVLLGHSSCFPK